MKEACQTFQCPQLTCASGQRHYQRQQLPQTHKPPELVQAVIELSAEGIVPDTDVLCEALPVHVHAKTEVSRQVALTCRLGSSQKFHRGHGAKF